MGIPDHLTCLLRNLYAGQQTTVRTGHGTTDWFQIGKGVHQGCILSPCLFNFYAEYGVFQLAQRLKHQCRRPVFDSWVGKIPWRRKWQPTSVFFPGESHGCRSLVGYSPWAHKESDTTERLHFHFMQSTS